MAVTPLDMRVRALLERFGDWVRNEGDKSGWTVRCPVHHPDDEVWAIVTDDGTLMPCAMGCDRDAMLSACEPIMQTRVPGEDDGEAAPAPSVWGFTPALAFLALTFQPQRWLYLDLVPAESVTVVMAAPNAGKTFFALDVVVQVAARAAADGRRVVIVEEEGTGAALQWRLSRALAATGRVGAENIRIAWNTGRSIRSKSDLASLAAECKSAELIMLDSLSALAGGVDENSSQDMAEVAEALHALRTATGAALLVLHHMTKAAWKDGETPRLEHIRGHGALPGRADAVLALVPLASDATEVRFELHCVKQRDGSKPPPRKFTVSMTGEAATATIDEAGPAMPAKASAIEADTYSKVPEKPDSVSKKFLEHVVRGHRAQEVRRAVDRLVDSGRIDVTANGRYVRSSGRAGTTPDDPPSSGSSPPRRGGTTERDARPVLDAVQRAAGEKEED